MDSLLAQDTSKLVRTYGRPLVLTPKETADGPVLIVSGTLDLFAGEADVMPLVAPQGFIHIENTVDTWYFADYTLIDTHTKKSIHTSISRALRRISWYHFGHGN
jgi:hypothetical protein